MLTISLNRELASATCDNHGKLFLTTYKIMLAWSMWKFSTYPYVPPPCLLVLPSSSFSFSSYPFPPSTFLLFPPLLPFSSSTPLLTLPPSCYKQWPLPSCALEGMFSRMCPWWHCSLYYWDAAVHRIQPCCCCWYQQLLASESHALHIAMDLCPTVSGGMAHWQKATNKGNWPRSRGQLLRQRQPGSLNPALIDVSIRTEGTIAWHIRIGGTAHDNGTFIYQPEEDIERGPEQERQTL